MNAWLNAWLHDTGGKQDDDDDDDDYDDDDEIDDDCNDDYDDDDYDDNYDDVARINTWRIASVSFRAVHSALRLVTGIDRLCSTIFEWLLESFD